MIRTSIYSKQNKIQPKKQRSQQPRAIRSRKNNSPSPAYKQINMNKQNMHPNQPHISLYLQQQQYRQTYYQMKQQNLQSRLEQQKQAEHQMQFPTGIRKNKIPRQIEIRLTNKSLEKCQIHPPFQPSPKAQYLLNYQQQKKQPDILCCDSCSSTFGNHYNRVNLDRITNTTIAKGFTIKHYYSLLLGKIDNLQKAKQNMLGWEKNWRQMFQSQGNKLRKYYNEILQVIQNSMKSAEDQLSAHINQGEVIISNKKQEIQKQLQKSMQQLRKLLIYQQKQLTFQFGSHLREISFDVESATKNIKLQIKLPVVHIFTQIQNLKTQFENLFKNSFSLQPLTSAQLEQISQERQREVLKTIKGNSMSMSPYSSHHSYNRTTTRQEEEPDLFCQQLLGDSKLNKTNEFSFQKSNDSSFFLGKNNDCILELVQEEDVISPVFKAI